MAEGTWVVRARAYVAEAPGKLGRWALGFARDHIVGLLLGSGAVSGYAAIAAGLVETYPGVVLGVVAVVLGSAGLLTLWWQQRRPEPSPTLSEDQLPADAPLRRILTLVLDELYRNESMPAGRPSDFRDAEQYADAALEAMRVAQLDSTLPGLRERLRSFRDEARRRNEIDAMGDPAEMSNEERRARAADLDRAGRDLLRMSLGRTLERCREEIEEFLYPDIQTGQRSLDASRFDMTSLDAFERRILRAVAPGVTLLVYEPEESVLRLRTTKGEVLSEDMSPFQTNDTIDVPPALAALNRLKQKGLLVGKVFAEHRLTARGYLVRTLLGD